VRHPGLARRATWTLPLLLLLLAIAGAIPGRCWAAPAAADGLRPATIIMEEDRPLASFARQFRERHGIGVTYEDPLGDAAEGDAAGAGIGAPAAARGAAVNAIWLSVSYRVSAASGQVEDPAGVIREALAAYHAAGATIHFKLLEKGAIYHIVPFERLDSSGAWVQVTPALDTHVDLARAVRLVFDTVFQILGQVEQATGVKVIWGYAPLNWVLSTRVELGGSPATARELLDGVLAGAPWTWDLLYSTRLKTYVLSVWPLSAGAPEQKR
jgi:hypothetical protein